MLPAVADLYGVTIDEILRGERAENATKTTISENAKHALRKNRYAKFNAKLLLLTMLAAIGAVLDGVSCANYLYSATPLWFDLLLIALGLSDTLVSLLLSVYLQYNLRVSECLVLQEDFDENGKAFALATQMQVKRIFKIVAYIFLGTAAVFTVLFVITARSDNWKIIIADTVLAIVIFVVSAIYGNVGFRKLASEKQIQTRKFNTKLAHIIVAYGMVPVILSVGLIVLFCFWTPSSVKDIYVAKDFETFKTHMQTLVVFEDIYHNEDVVCRAGEYMLNFPENAKFSTDGNLIRYDLGNNFIGTRWSSYSDADKKYIYSWNIFIATEPNDSLEMYLVHMQELAVPAPNGSEQTHNVVCAYYDGASANATPICQRRRQRKL